MVVNSGFKLNIDPEGEVTLNNFSVPWSTMKRITHELDSWDEGRAFMNRISDEVGGKIQEDGANLKMENEAMTVSCHFDDREFSYILIKLSDESKETMVRSILGQFKKN